MRFCYERPYEIWTQTQEYLQYRPDFFLPDYNIYIEHHALDERDSPPRGWKGYKERVEWHRRTHRKYGTKLTSRPLAGSTGKASSSTSWASGLKEKGFG